MRLYYSHVGSPFVDIEWNKEAVLKYKNRIANIWNLIKQIQGLKDQKNENIDNWLISVLQRTIQKTDEAFDNFDLRVATNEVFFECQKNLQWYIKRGGSNKKLLDDFIKTWITLMTPITPHLAEEIWNQNNNSFISDESFPTYNSELVSDKDEVGEYLLSEVTDDISEIIKVTKIKAKKICIYTSPKWKKEVMIKAINMSENRKVNIGILMKDLMQDSKLKEKGKEISQFTSKLPSEIMKLNENDKIRYTTEIDEKKYLEHSKDYLEKIFSSKIEIISADEKNIYDPANKIRFAVPLRPAIYIE